MRNAILVTLIIGLTGLNSCKKDNPTPAPTTRTYRMGLQNSAPRYDNFDFVLQALYLWSTRADAAMITTEVPWDTLLSGQTPQQYVLNNYSGLVDYYRTKNFKLWVYIDPANGLNRQSDADALVARGKSIADGDVQKIYRRFVVVMDSMLHPDHLGLALETNLIRASSPAAIYSGVKTAANAAAADIRASGSNVKLSVSVQADQAWGKVLSSDQINYVGVDEDFIDFPFMEEMGISSYPYFNYSKPEDLPANYYSRLVEGKTIDVFVTEGGWTSASFPELNGAIITSSPETQQHYIAKQGIMLADANATAWFQLTWTDIDLTAVPDTTNPIIKYFAYLGLVDVDLQPKPALTEWDAQFKLTLKEK